MTLRDFIDNINDDEFIYLMLGEYGFASANSFRKCTVNKSSKLLDCKVQSVGSGSVDGDITIIVRIECEDLNDIRDFFKRD